MNYDIGFVFLYPQGTLAIDGRKKWLIKRKRVVTHIDATLLALEQNHALGTIRLKEVGLIPKSDLKKFYNKHLVTEDELRERKLSRIPEFWAYEITVVERFPRPIAADYSDSALTWVKSSSIKLGKRTFAQSVSDQELTPEARVKKAFTHWWRTGEGKLPSILDEADAAFADLLEARTLPRWDNPIEGLLFVMWWNRAAKNDKAIDRDLQMRAEAECSLIQHGWQDSAPSAFEGIPKNVLRSLKGFVTSLPEEEYNIIWANRIESALKSTKKETFSYLPVLSEKPSKNKGTLEDVLEVYTDPAILYHNAVCLVGSLPAQGQGNDADLLIRKEVPEAMLERITFRLGRAAVASPDIQIHILNDEGPYSPFVPLYHIGLIPAEQTIITEMQRTKPRLFEPIIPMKPLRVPPNAPSTREAFLEMLEAYGVEGGLEPKYNGIHAFVSSDGERISVLTEQGNDITDAVSHLLHEFPKGEWILDTELELWEASEHKPREAVIGAVAGRRQTSYVFMVFDVLFHEGEATSSRPYSERRKVLESIMKGYPATMDSPERAVALGVSIPVRTLKDVRTGMKDILERDHIEGVVWKQGEGHYHLDGRNPGSQVKWHRTVRFEAMVLERTESATPNVYNYTYGVPSDGLPILSSVIVKGKEYLRIGKTFSTSAVFEVGDVILIEAEQVNLVITDNGIDITGWAPKIIVEEK